MPVSVESPFLVISRHSVLKGVVTFFHEGGGHTTQYKWTRIILGGFHQYDLDVTHTKYV
jgi:hypothetical protein